MERSAGRPTDGGAVDHLPGQYLPFAVGMAINPEVAAMVRRDIGALRIALEPWAAPYDYQNFRESDDAAGRFWAAETLARLRAVVDAVDPQRVIKSAHSVD